MIAITALREKIRKKVFFVVLILGVLITLLFGMGDATVTVGGVEVTDYEMLLPVILTVLHIISCVMAVVLSLSTIPNEYERRTSHLIWIRGVSQAGYHGELALANVAASLVSHGILFLCLMGFMISKGHASDLWRVVPAYLVSGISVAMVSLFTSWLSLILPTIAAGVISTFFMLAGIAYPLVELLKGLAGGFSGILLKYLLAVLPNLHSIQSAGGALLTGGAMDWHILFRGLLYAYLFVVGILVCRRKEA